jgi:hypothetical protein
VTPVPASNQHRPEVIAAVTNGLLVFLSPIGLAVISALFENTNTSVTVRPPLSFENVAARSYMLAAPVLLCAPFAALAAWRTWVHAVRWRAGLGSGLRGILEAGLTGLIPMLVYLLPGIVSRPAEAPPYVIAYGGMAFVAGLVVGAILWTAAIVVMHLASWALHEKPAT